MEDHALAVAGDESVTDQLTMALIAWYERLEVYVNAETDPRELAHCALQVKDLLLTQGALAVHQIENRALSIS